MTTVILGLAVGFVGCSVSSPILRFLKEKKVLPGTESSVSEPTQPVQEMTETQPGIAESATEPLDLPSIADMHGFYLPEDALATEASLRAALEQVPVGTTHVAAQLKTKGGFLHYASGVEDAGICGAVVSALPLETICSIIHEAGFVPAACINALEDSVYPRTYASAGYQNTLTGEKWLYSNGGTGASPMLSPFSGLTEYYLCSITAEVSAAGFDVIICQGLIFPEFSEEDLAVLGADVASDDRYTALADIAASMQEAAGDAVFLIEADGRYLLDNSTETESVAETVRPDGVLILIDEETSAKRMTLRSAFSGMQCAFVLDTDTPLTEDTLEQLTIDGSYWIPPDTALGILSPEDSAESTEEPPSSEAAENSVQDGME